jgi:Capsule assembly protein Wzi
MITLRSATRCALVAFAATLATVGWLPTVARGAPAISPLDEEYPLLREMARLGAAPRLSSHTLTYPWQTGRSSAAEVLQSWAPPTRSGLGIWLRPFANVIALTTDPPRQLRPVFDNVRQGSAVDPTWRYQLGALVDAQLHPKVDAHIRFNFESDGRNQTLNRTRRFGQLDASNNFDEAYLRGRFGRAQLRMGRFAQSWGPERLGSLILSETAPAPDLLHLQLEMGAHTLQAFAGQLSAESTDSTTVRRWLYGHRLDLYFADDDLRIGLSELAVVAGQSEGLSLRYLNPVSLWAQVQVESDEERDTEVNILNAVDAEYLHHGLRVYGTLVVDDIQIDPGGRKVNPDQLAWSAGADIHHGDRSQWLWGYEYRRLGSWAYLRRFEGTDFRQFRRPLGAPEGPDTDRHNLLVSYRPRPTARIWLEGERRRRGVNRLWTEDSRIGQAGRPFPLGTVEKRWIVSAGADADLPRLARVSLALTYQDITNENNAPGQDEGVWEIFAAVHLRSKALGWAVEGD